MSRDHLEHRATGLSELIGVKRVLTTDMIAGGYRLKDSEGGHYNNVRP